MDIEHATATPALMLKQVVESNELTIFTSDIGSPNGTRVKSWYSWVIHLMDYWYGVSYDKGSVVQKIHATFNNADLSKFDHSSLTSFREKLCALNFQFGSGTIGLQQTISKIEGYLRTELRIEKQMEPFKNLLDKDKFASLRQQLIKRRIGNTLEHKNVRPAILSTIIRSHIEELGSKYETLAGLHEQNLRILRQICKEEGVIVWERLLKESADLLSKGIVPHILVSVLNVYEDMCRCVHQGYSENSDSVNNHIYAPGIQTYFRSKFVEKFTESMPKNAIDSSMSRVLNDFKEQVRDENTHLEHLACCDWKEIVE